MSVDRFESASGLRPASAFVAIACVLGVVAARGTKMTLADEGLQPANERALATLPTGFEILARDGTPLALSVERLQLVMSPNAMWQAHTPRRMAERVAEHLGDAVDPDELVARMLPDAQDGLVRVDPRALALEPAAAARFARWIEVGAGEERPVRGIWICEPASEPGPTRTAPLAYELRYEPEVLLSEAVRAEQGFDKPQAWTRAIADALLSAQHGRPPREWTRTAEELEAARREVWRALMPTRFKVVVPDVPAAAALPLLHLFETEWVHEHQMMLARGSERRYPVRGFQREVAFGGGDPPFEVLGCTGTYAPEIAARIARGELGLASDEECEGERAELLSARVHSLVFERHPLNGLERLCATLLDDPRWSFLERRAGTYAFLANQAPRAPLRRHFRDVTAPSEVPRVRTTIDFALQRSLRQVLEGVMVEHDPALALAIAIELSTGDVLALDALDAYGVSGFSPVQHTFTPGSTFKLVTMATALDAGVVRPETVFDTFDGDFVTGTRRIREAEGAPTGRITAAQAIAGSCNAVLAQVGQLVPDERFRSVLVQLGYGSQPGAGLGPERAGLLPRTPWKRDWTHASIGFGHEIAVTFWQHAAALATVVRGGEWRPLNLLDGVEQNGVLHPVARAEPRRVLSESACDEVREMMILGAHEGTGARVRRDDLVMGTKTGTAEKVSTEVCLHVELEHQSREHACGKACLRALRGQKQHRKSCYTSSMCTFGRLPDGTREVLVLVVVDEPRGLRKYGSDVAGRAAVEILARALGADAPAAIAPDASGFASLGDVVVPEVAEEPWYEMADAGGAR